MDGLLFADRTRLARLLEYKAVDRADPYRYRRAITVVTGALADTVDVRFVWSYEVEGATVGEGELDVALSRRGKLSNSASAALSADAESWLTRTGRAGA